MKTSDGVIREAKGEKRKMSGKTLGVRAPDRSRRDDTGDSAAHVEVQANSP